MAMIGGMPGPMPPAPKNAKEQAKQIDDGISKTLGSLGFSQEYIKQLLTGVQTARKQYEDYLKQFGGKMDDKAPKPTEGDKAATGLAQLQYSTAVQGLAVSQSIAMAALFPGLGTGTGSPPPAEPAKKDK